jgi:hypothetical protein
MIAQYHLVTINLDYPSAGINDDEVLLVIYIACLRDGYKAVAGVQSVDGR